MVIRKLYRIESAHIVRNAYSERCSHSYHGHSGVIEVFLKSDGLDNAGMIYDFGALKQHVGAFSICLIIQSICGKKIRKRI